MAGSRYPWEIIGENANELPNGLKSNVETNRCRIAPERHFPKASTQSDKGIAAEE